MYHNSTQRSYWTFSSEEELKTLRANANKNYRERFCSQHTNIGVDDDDFFLTTKEHLTLVRYYEAELKDFCWKFNPPMPLNVIGTACTYFRRLYLRKSIMDYHPKLMYLVCIWLTCKTEEFNISMEQFAQSISSSTESLRDAILTMELILIQELNFHLTIHNAFRPLEGFFIDVKTRFSSLANPEQLRKFAKDFLVHSLSTDAGLLFSPSQIALSALLSAASKRGINIDKYVTEVLMKGQPQEMLKPTILRIKKIRTIVKNADLEVPSKEVIKHIERKLALCYDKMKDPRSQEYLEMQGEIEAERHERHAKKRKVEKEKRRKIEADLLRF